jgi:F-type H+-transporting ATPase subunit gamma
MAQEQTLKRRIRSVKNAKQITKALEVVAAARMRKIQSAVANARAYGDAAASIIRRVAPSQEALTHPYFRQSNASRVLYIVFTSDRGQAGAFNSNIFHAIAGDIENTHQTNPSVIVFGRKGARFFSKISNINLLGAYENVDDVPNTNVFAPVLEAIERGMDSGNFDCVRLVYTEFVSALAQRSRVTTLLPITLAEEVESTDEAKIVYEFEPTLESVLEEALRLYFESQLMQARIESAASEHAMRMIAMGNANRNAGDLIDSITLELNATRQAGITQQIAEITGGAAAIAS